MFLSYHNFEKLKPGYYVFADEGGEFSAILPDSYMQLCKLFFPGSIAFDLTLPHSKLYDILSKMFWLVSSGDLYCFGTLVAHKISTVSLGDFMVHEGYLYLLLYVQDESCDNCFEILTLATFDEFRFVGSVSSGCGGVSSAELSRVILANPEINWDV